MSAPRKSLKKKKEKKVEPKRDLPPQVVTRQLGDNIYTGIIREDPLGSQFLETSTAKYLWNTGIRYEGPFASSQIEGKGKFSWPDGSSYEGELHNGKRHGEGLYMGHDGVTKYEGQWRMGKRDGYGLLHYNASGTALYDGEWKDGKKHGEGKQVWPSGNVYEGQWVLSKMSGYGMMSWRTGSILEQYKGFWEDNHPHGEGTHTWLATEPLSEASGHRGRVMPALQHQQQQNNRYTGQWHRGKREGIGTFYYANGAYYHGEWKNHVKQGHGRHTFEDGNVYEGPFSEDRMTQYSPPTDHDDKNPVCRRIDISDLQVTAHPADHAGFEATGGNGYADSAKIIREVHNTLLRNLSELRELYNRYRVLVPLPGEDPFIMQNHQLWMFARDAGLVTPHCTLSCLDRLVFSGPRHLRETAPEDSRDTRPLTPKALEQKGGAESMSECESKERLSHPASQASQGDSSEEEESVSLASSMHSPAHLALDMPADMSGISGMRYVCRRTGLSEDNHLKNTDREELELAGKSEPESPARLRSARQSRPATDIHHSTKSLLFRQFLDGIVRMSLGRFPHERGLEVRIHRIFKEQVLPMHERPTMSEDIWAFLVNQDFRHLFREFEPALRHLFRGAVAGKEPEIRDDPNTMYRFSSFGAPKRQLRSQCRIDETVRLKDVLRLLARAGLLRPMPASVYPTDDPFVHINTPEEEEDGADDGNVSADENASGGSNSPEQEAIDEEKVPSAKKSTIDSKSEPFDIVRNAFEARPPFDPKSPPFNVAHGRSFFIPQSSLLTGSEDSASVSEAAGPVSTQRKRNKAKDQEAKKGTAEGPRGPRAEDFAKCDLRVTPLSLLKLAAGVMSDGACESIHWQLNPEGFGPGDERVSLLEYAEVEMVFPEFLRLLVCLVHESTRRDSALCQHLSLMKRLEGFLRFVLFPALETPYSPPEMPKPALRSDASHDQAQTDAETVSAAGQEVPDSASQVLEGTQAAEEEADPIDVVQPPQVFMCELWQGFEEGTSAASIARAHRVWPAGYGQQVLKW